MVSKVAVVAGDGTSFVTAGPVGGVADTMTLVAPCPDVAAVKLTVAVRLPGVTPVMVGARLVPEHLRRRSGR